MAEEIEKQLISKYTEKAYLDYSMYVILDRALPHIADGLKPVQRRITYAMSQLGLHHSAKYKKSARTIGDVLGKFHPHGEIACYEAMVLLAQPFSTRYPMIDGQGNWGSQDDPKSFAAMRYTEAKLTKYSDLLLAELEEGTVNWTSNFDGTLQEPVLLPSRVPNVLLNGATGIAVGMATDLLPHNMREVLKACIFLLDNPKATIDDILLIIKGPDFPTEAEIISSKEEITSLYKEGTGSIKQRAKYTIEDGDIVISALPYQVSSAKVVEQIADQIVNKKMPLIADIRDESDHDNPIRLVLVPRSNKVDVKEVMSHLFATTDLEKNYRGNFNVIGIDGKPKVKNLFELLSEWLSFRIQTVKKRLSFRLDNISNRLHILDGYLIAYLNLDKVIEVVKNAENPKKELIKLFKLSELQVEAILNMRLRHLAKLEKIKIQEEQKKLTKEAEELTHILSSSDNLKKYVRNEIEEDSKTFSDPRKSPIVNRPIAQAMKIQDTVPSEIITVILSNKGWIRAGKGQDIDPKSLSYKSGDDYQDAIIGRSNRQVIIFDSIGRIYSVPAHSLPSARGQGEPLTSKIDPPNEARLLYLLMEPEEEQLVLVTQDLGYGFITKVSELVVKNKAGRQLLTMIPNSEVLPPRLIKNVATQNIIAVTNDGRLLCFALQELPELAKGKGNKIIHIPVDKLKPREIYVQHLLVIDKEQGVMIRAGSSKLVLKGKELEEYYLERGKRGKQLPKKFRSIDSIENV